MVLLFGLTGWRFLKSEVPLQNHTKVRLWMPVLYSTRKGGPPERGFPRNRLMSNVYINDFFSVFSRPRRARPGLRPHRMCGS